jgi:hypothetical protein
MESLKPDCAFALQRKTPENLPAAVDVTLSPVRFEGKTCGIAAIFSDSCSNAAGFLCGSDCVAETVGFENTHKRRFNIMQSTGGAQNECKAAVVGLSGP